MGGENGTRYTTGHIGKEKRRQDAQVALFCYGNALKVRLLSFFLAQHELVDL
jgi:hypothetical protein